MRVEPEDAEELEELFSREEGFGHLRVKKRGQSLTIVSGTPAHPHARLTALDGAQWGLSLPRHTGRWEPTPFTGTMEELASILMTDLPFYLEDPSQSHGGPKPGQD